MLGFLLVSLGLHRAAVPAAMLCETQYVAGHTLDIGCHLAFESMELEVICEEIVLGKTVEGRLVFPELVRET